VVDAKKAKVRSSDRLRTLQTNNIDGPGKDPSTPMVIEDDEYDCDDVHEDLEIDPKIGSCVQAIRNLTTWDDISRRMTQ
ncbi:hypothetical protein A2U01_0075550, partial [Trifolium medium]|nr:hypothetical protein [Trifolium medium]